MHYLPSFEILEGRDTLACLTPAPQEAAFLDLLNAARRSQIPPGYPTHTWVTDSRLLAVARSYAEDLRDRLFFSHWNPEGLGPGERLSAAAVPWVDWGESLAGGYPDNQQALDALLASAGHRRHLLGLGPSLTHTKVGVGIARGGRVYDAYWVVLSAELAGPDPCLLENLYTRHLGRLPAAEEVALWQGVAESAIPALIRQSAESLTRQVTGWYTAYLRRQPDPAGLAHWVHALAAGAPALEVEAAFLTAPEYGRGLPGLYEDLLGRPLSPQEALLWDDVPLTVAPLVILQSQEFTLRRQQEGGKHA